MARKQKTPIDIPGLDLARAKRYSRIRLVLLIVSTVWSLARLNWFAADRRAARLKGAIARGVPDRRLTGPAFFTLFALGSWLTSLPLAFVSGHVVERRFGLTRQTPSGWLSDQIKGLVLGVLLQTPLLTASFPVIRRRPRDWWLVLSAAAVPFTVLLSNLAPVLLMPIFNRFTPLRNEDLGQRVRLLATRSGVRVGEVYEMDMSRQSEKPNAMFTGIGNTKRIVLGDTLLARFAPDEIEAVVAHELGHQVHGDIWRLIGVGSGLGFGLAWLLARLAPPVLSRTSEETGVSDPGDEAALPVLAILMTLLGFVVMPLQAAFSRAVERRADRFALDLTRDGGAYARAMEKLAVQSLADPDPPRAVVFMLASHPPIAERIQTAREWEHLLSGGTAP